MLEIGRASLLDTVMSNNKQRGSLFAFWREVFFISRKLDMESLIARIKQDGTVLGEDILKVDSFLTHQVDPKLMREIGRVFAEKFKTVGLTKIVTIEASGNVPAAYVAEELGIPMIFAKKAKNVTMTDDLLTADVYSFTKKVTSTIQISQKFLSENDKVLVIDDFLANGQAALGVISILNTAGCEVAGVGIVIEKSFQTGRALVEEAGVPVYSLARVAGFDQGQVIFGEADL